MLHILLVLALNSSVAPPPLAQPGYAPMQEQVFSEDLQAAGYDNGDMPGYRLMDVDGCLLERDAAYTLSLLTEAARAEGMGSLYPHDCYRSLDAQHAAYERRCPEVEEEITEIDPESGEEVVVATRTERQCSGPPIATPGRSAHGWGRAVDFGNGARTLGCGDAELAWLQENAAAFGWVHPEWAHCGRVTQEPWHWEWGGVTDALPLPSPTFGPDRPRRFHHQ